MQNARQVGDRVTAAHVVCGTEAGHRMIHRNIRVFHQCVVLLVAVVVENHCPPQLIDLMRFITGSRWQRNVSVLAEAAAFSEYQLPVAEQLEVFGDTQLGADLHQHPFERLVVR